MKTDGKEAYIKHNENMSVLLLYLQMVQHDFEKFTDRHIARRVTKMMHTDMSSSYRWTVLGLGLDFVFLLRPVYLC